MTQPLSGNLRLCGTYRQIEGSAARAAPGARSPRGASPIRGRAREPWKFNQPLPSRGVPPHTHTAIEKKIAKRFLGASGERAAVSHRARVTGRGVRR